MVTSLPLILVTMSPPGGRSALVWAAAALPAADYDSLLGDLAMLARGGVVGYDVTLAIDGKRIPVTSTSGVISAPLQVLAPPANPPPPKGSRYSDLSEI